MPVLIGFDKCHYAIVTEGDGTDTYATPKPLPGAISLNITPQTNDAVLYADNGPYESATALGGIDVELSLAELSLEDQVTLFGQKLSSDGVVIRSGSDVQPYIALGGRCLQSDGTYRYFWLLKGKLSLSSTENKTKGESIEYNTPTLSGSFITAQNGQWLIEANSKKSASAIANWFQAVPTVTPAPTALKVEEK